MYACNGILFNHEGSLRGESFVTRRITRAMARIALGLQNCLYLGNLGALRDGGHACDHVQMQWLMLQQAQPEDFVIATGVQYSVRQFVEFAAAELGISVRFEGEGGSEVGIVAAVSGGKARCKPGDVIVRVDPRYFRHTEAETLPGDPGKAKRKLGWEPTTTFEQLVREMVKSHFEAARRDSLVRLAGFKADDYHESLEALRMPMRGSLLTIPEAARRVLPVAAIGESGQVPLLDMGEPVKIVDLARHLSRLVGHAAAEFLIVFSGLRPGEKLYEEQLADADDTLPTHVPRLRVAQPGGGDGGVSGRGYQGRLIAARSTCKCGGDHVERRSGSHSHLAAAATSAHRRSAYCNASAGRRWPDSTSTVKRSPAARPAWAPEVLSSTSTERDRPRASSRAARSSMPGAGLRQSQSPP